MFMVVTGGTTTEHLIKALGWALGLALLTAVLVWRGCLRPGSLGRCPSRDIGLGGLDLVAGLMWYALAPALLARLGLDVDPAEAQSSGERALGLLVMQAVIQLPVLVYMVHRALWRFDLLRRVGLLPRDLVGEVKAGLVGWLMAVPMVFSAIGVAVELAAALGQPGLQVGHEMLIDIKCADSQWTRASLIVSAVILAPIFEETIFRGLLQTVMVAIAGTRRRWWIVLSCAALFALAHVGETVDVRTLPGLFVLGVILGWLYERTGSLLPGVLVHGGFNAVNTTIVLLVDLTPRL